MAVKLFCHGGEDKFCVRVVGRFLFNILQSKSLRKNGFIAFCDKHRSIKARVIGQADDSFFEVALVSFADDLFYRVIFSLHDAVKIEIAQIKKYRD